MKRKRLLKIQNLAEKDWRGILAFIIMIGGFVVAALAIIYDRLEAFAAIGTLMYAVADWYFKSRDKE